MTKKLIIYSSLIMLLGFSFTACNRESITADYNIVPLPQKIEINSGGTPFRINKSTEIAYPGDNERLKSVAHFLAEYIYFSTGMELAVSTDNKAGNNNVIYLKTNFANGNEEAYNIAVNSDNVTINGSSDAGTFYGVQTLRKSISANAEEKDILLPAADITDFPRFKYRGMHLDVSRHFFPIDFVKRYVDILAMHNINRLHWHLTDDQGWRIEIKKHPKLIEESSVRKETLVGSLYAEQLEFDNTPYGGYYTQEEIKDLVSYADERFITVVPEIDLPGHMLAVLSAYPELGCTGGPYEVGTKWGVFEDVLCAGKEESFNFLDDVFSEVVELFPSKYIHIGGDECPKAKWKVCPHCQARANKLGLKKTSKYSREDLLQSYFMERIEKMLNDKNKDVIGWDEILQGGLAPSATVMSWRGTEGGIEAAQLGHDAIMTPHQYLYFDYYQSKDRSKEPLAIGDSYLPIEKVYEYEPVPEIFTEQQSKHIIGVQANLWTEYIPTAEQVEYMLLPRLAALSEVQWMNAENKNYDDFLDRVGRLTPYYSKYNYNFAKHVLNKIVDDNK